MTDFRHWLITSTAALAAVAFQFGAPASTQAAIQCRIHDSQEILSSLLGAPGRPTSTTGTAQALQFVDPSGRAWDLITDINDPAILNHGSGSFHAADPGEVQRAFDALARDGVGDLVVDVYLLPYPRRALLASNADERGIYLSPGVYPYSTGQLHSLVTHELGHAWQFKFMPDSDSDAWLQYRSLRGIGDATIYNASAAHRNRPHEIFAEDFRVLFGGQLANYSQSVENSDLAYPREIPGLTAFIAGLTSGQAAAGEDFALVSTPNPFNPLTTIRFTLPVGQHQVALAIVDAGGRLVRELVQDELGEGEYQYRWDGRSGDGGRAASGVYFARLVAGVHRTNYKLILAR